MLRPRSDRLIANAKHSVRKDRPTSEIDRRRARRRRFVQRRRRGLRHDCRAMNPHVLGYASMGIGVGLGFVLSAASAGIRNTLSGWAVRVVGTLLRRPSRFAAIRPDEIEWRENQAHRDRTRFFMKPLSSSDDRSSVLMLVRYPAGQINPSHVHQVGHGMYVLSGELCTHRGTFGPDTYVWFPANEVMWHGAGPAEDLVVLFCTGRGMDTRYVGRPPG